MGKVAIFLKVNKVGALVGVAADFVGDAERVKFSAWNFQPAVAGVGNKAVGQEVGSLWLAVVRGHCESCQQSASASNKRASKASAEDAESKPAEQGHGGENPIEIGDSHVGGSY